MPNWVTARLTIHGEKAEDILNNLLVEDEEESDEVRFDFNKILPMPKELEVVAGSVTDKCVEVYLSTLSNSNAKTKEKLFMRFSSFGKNLDKVKTEPILIFEK